MMMAGINTLRMRLSRMAVLGFFIPVMVLGICSCTHKSSGDAAGAPTQGTAVISKKAGGAISVNTSSGQTVTLEIPENALTQDTTISLSANSLEDISIQPQPDLLDAATLTITGLAVGDSSNRYIFFKGDSGRLQPLKQSVVDGALKSTIYRLGGFSYTLPDMSKMITDAYAVMNDNPSTSWQVSFSAFDALVWYSGYFMNNGHSSEAAECTKATVSVCRVNAEKFIETAKTDNSTKDIPYVKGLKKFRYLMVLNDNPGLLTKTFDELIKATDNSL